MTASEREHIRFARDRTVRERLAVLEAREALIAAETREVDRLLYWRDYHEARREHRLGQMRAYYRNRRRWQPSWRKPQRKVRATA